MFGASEFIKQRLPKGAVYSEVIWQSSVVSGGNSIVNVDYGSTGAKWILINGLTLSADNVGGQVDFIDAFNLVLFTMFEFRDISGVYDFWYLMKGSTLKLTASSPTIKFSVGHQYITMKEESR